eukprot:g1351.t1
MSVSTDRYYSTFQGHPPEYLDAVIKNFRNSNKSLIFLAGDSSLDNKYWFADSGPAINGYENILTRPRMKRDVCYALNQECVTRKKDNWACVNTAIEASTLNDRSCGRLLPQDRVILENITSDDILIVSVGGNDVALQPLLCTVCSALGLVWCGGPLFCVEKLSCACPVNLGMLGDLGCLCCGVPNCLINTPLGFPLGLGYMVDLFKNRVENYVRRVIGKKRPKKVMVCMIYFLDEKREESWSELALSCLLYNQMPSRLQAGIRKAFELGTKKIKIKGTEVVPMPLFDVLDSKDTNDYIARVEPSPQASVKMAKAMMNRLFVEDNGDAECDPVAESNMDR